MTGLLLASVILVLAVLFNHAAPTASTAHTPSVAVFKQECPCTTPELCTAVKHEHSKEVFGFCPEPAGNHYHSYDLQQLTTMAWIKQQEAMCYAHSKHSRLVLDGRKDVFPALLNISAQSQWVNSQLRQALDLDMDGINFDLEDPATPESPLSTSYTRLVTKTAAVFHRHIQGSQVSVDVPWSPYDADGRNYDWQGLAAAADILFVMAYDMQSQIYGACVAAANSPAALVQKGLHQWLDVGVPRHKLVLGLPWYGYSYPCQADSSGKPMDEAGDICRLMPVPFRGAPCSDAAGGQIGYGDIMKILASGSNTTAVLWDDRQQSPHFNYRETDGLIHQVWFDNPESLAIKYQLAADLGLRGVGMWHLEALDYESQDPVVVRQTAAMWEALKAVMDSVAKNDDVLNTWACRSSCYQA